MKTHQKISMCLLSSFVLLVGVVGSSYARRGRVAAFAIGRSSGRSSSSDRATISAQDREIDQLQQEIEELEKKVDLQSKQPTAGTAAQEVEVEPAQEVLVLEEEPSGDEIVTGHYPR